MFEAFYNLSDNPFRLTPDPKFCFRHPSHDQAYAYLQYALKLGEGFIMVTGRPGIGKTTLAQVFLKELEFTEVIAARVASANVEATDLMRVVAYAYGIDVEGLDKATVLVRLRQFFVAQTRAGKRVLLIIDEAQGLPYPALEELRLLADMQMDSLPLLQLFLVGQEKLRDLMQEPAMEQFQQRVIGVCHLEPLSLTDTRAYMEHRLRKADWRGDPELSGEAMLAIYQFSKGVPRHVNKICTRLLLDGFMEKKHKLRERDVLGVANAMRAERLAPLGNAPAIVADANDEVLPTELEDGSLTVSDLALRADPQQPPPVSVKTPPEAETFVEEVTRSVGAEQEAADPGQAAFNTAGVSSRTVSSRPGVEGPSQRKRHSPPPAASGFKRTPRQRTGRTSIPAWKSKSVLQSNKRTPYLTGALGRVNDRLSELRKGFDSHAAGARLRHYRGKIVRGLEAYPVFRGRPGIWVGGVAAAALVVTLLLNSGGDEPGDRYGVMREELSEPASVTVAVAEPELPVATVQTAARRDFESASLERFDYRPVAPREGMRVNSDEPAQRADAIVTSSPRGSTSALPAPPDGSKLPVDEAVLSNAEAATVPDSVEKVQDSPQQQQPAVLSPDVAIAMLQDTEVATGAALVEPTGAPAEQAEIPVQVTEPAHVVSEDAVDISIVEDPGVPEPVSREDRIIELLSLGQRALRSDRLLIPVDDNAYKYYQQVLELEPGNSAAMFGLDQIVERYIALGNVALVHEDKVKANRYIARGFRVMPGDSRLLALQSRVNAPAVADVQVKVQPSMVEPEPEKKNLMSWLKTIFGEAESSSSSENDDVQVDDYSF